MAFTHIAFENNHTGELKEAPVGFSWTVLLFGIFPPLFRADWKNFAIILIPALLTWGLSSVVFAFIYNKMYGLVRLTRQLSKNLICRCEACTRIN